jgi:hypothetical protein
MKAGNITLARAFGPPGKVSFNPITGMNSALPASEARPVTGNLCSVGRSTFALFLLDNVLYFQWDQRRWSMDVVTIRYEHDFQQATTTFAVEGETVQYPAWWRDEPHYDPNVPERDADEDYLGYIALVSRDKDLREALKRSWQSP